MKCVSSVKILVLVIGLFGLLFFELAEGRNRYKKKSNKKKKFVPEKEYFSFDDGQIQKNCSVYDTIGIGMNRTQTSSNMTKCLEGKVYSDLIRAWVFSSAFPTTQNKFIETLTFTSNMGALFVILTLWSKIMGRKKNDYFLTTI